MELLNYGTQVNIESLKKYVKHSISVNETSQDKDKKQTPVCIWGRHGIGKTEIVEQIAEELDYKFTYIAPAQFEEMGDLVGMPSIENGLSVFHQPDWVPRGEGPGILLIDDVNRADDRILRGIMQLLQNYELVSWKLPKGWQIILTANPDGGDYSVTPMDDAMLTRMTHITLEFNVQNWAEWAMKNDIDQRGINFALTYPETITGKRTTPRSMVQFCNAIAPIKDLEKDIDLVKMIADGCLDANTTTSFISFVKNNLAKLISPEQILTTDNFKRDIKDFQDQVSKKTLRVDVISTVVSRLIHHISIESTKIDKKALENIKKFIKLPFIPGDIRLTFLQELVTKPKTKTIVMDSEISKLLLSKM